MLKSTGLDNCHLIRSYCRGSGLHLERFLACVTCMKIILVPSVAESVVEKRGFLLYNARKSFLSRNRWINAYFVVEGDTLYRYKNKYVLPLL